jgi:hypothetical protein
MELEGRSKARYAESPLSSQFVQCSYQQDRNVDLLIHCKKFIAGNQLTLLGYGRAPTCSKYGTIGAAEK